MPVDLTHRFHELLAAAWRQRYVIALPILIMPLVGLAVGLLSPREFETHTTMLVQETAKLNPFLEDLAVSSNLEERMAALRTLLHSRHILGEVAEELGLIRDDAERSARDRAIGELSAASGVQLIGKDLIRISYQAADPDGMREALETISRHFVEQLLAPERSSLAASERFLDEQLAERAEELDQAEAMLAAFKEEHADDLPELHAGNVARLRQLRQLLAERESELAGAQRSLASFEAQIARTNPVVGRLEEQLVTTQGELATLRARYTDEHSLVLGALRKLRRLEEERQRLLSGNPEPGSEDRFWDLASMVASGEELGRAQPLLVSQLEQLQLARSKSDGLGEEIGQLKKLVADLEAEIVGFGHQEQRLAELERDLRVKRRLYEDLLERREKAEVTGSLGRFEQADRVKSIDNPFTPTAPVNPSVVLFVIGGLFAGLALGGGLAVLLELLDTSIRRRKTLETLTGVPVLSRIPPLLPPGTAVETVRQTDGLVPAEAYT
jgi:polysaccharide chain length determinant protein (PEP-CTERM system associated)